MTDLSDAAMRERARKFLRDLNDAMSNPRTGDYYQGDISDPHRTLHMIEAAFLAEHDAARAQQREGDAKIVDLLTDPLRLPVGQPLLTATIIGTLASKICFIASSV